MSFVHYLSIGHYRLDEERPASSLGQRVRAHFVPGGLARLDAPEKTKPLRKSELARVERVLRDEYLLEVVLERFLLETGVLSVPYTMNAGPWRIAWPIALVAYEELGATVSERGTEYTEEQLRRYSAAAVSANEQTRALLAKSTVDRVREVVEEIRAEKQNGYQASVLFEDAGPEVIRALEPLLTESNAALQVFASNVLAKLGPDAAPAVPAFERYFENRGRRDSIYYVHGALDAIGPAAEPALRRMLEFEKYADLALLTLGRFESLSPETRAAIEPLSQGDTELAEMARHALGDSFIKRKLAKRRADRVTVPDDVEAWARKLPRKRIARVVASALDAISVCQFPSGGKLSRAVAKAIRANELTEERLSALRAKHQWAQIRGYDGPLYALALAALEDRDALLSLLERLENRAHFFLLVHG